MIEFQEVTLAYHGVLVLEHLDFCVSRGDYFAIVGPNGCGKTTILKAILGILKPRRGRILRCHPLVIGYVPQRETLNTFFPLTTLEMVLMGRYAHLGVGSRPGENDRRKAWESLDQVGLSEKGHDLYRDLSGGQKQRALLARALVSEPHLLILDEPTNGTDLGAQERILDLIDHLWQEKQMTILLVSHNLNLVTARASHAILISGTGEYVTGDVENLFCGPRLSALYGLPVAVWREHGHCLVVAERRKG